MKTTTGKLTTYVIVLAGNSTKEKTFFENAKKNFTFFSLNVKKQGIYSKIACISAVSIPSTA